MVSFVLEVSMIMGLPWRGSRSEYDHGADFLVGVDAAFAASAAKACELRIAQSAPLPRHMQREQPSVTSFSH